MARLPVKPLHIADELVIVTKKSLHNRRIFLGLLIRVVCGRCEIVFVRNDINGGAITSSMSNKI